VTYEQKPLDFKALVEQEVEKQKKAAEDKGLALTLGVQPGAYTIHGDAGQLSHAVLNLIDNAIKYTPNGTVAVELSKKDATILLSVKDSGIGVSAQDKDHIFTEGGRREDSLKYNPDAAGFGLAFVKGVVEHHHGRVWYESNAPEQGTTFWVEVSTGRKG